MCEYLDSPLQIDLILVESSLLAGVYEASLDSEHKLPPIRGIVYVLFQVLEQVNKAHLLGHIGGIVVQG